MPVSRRGFLGLVGTERAAYGAFLSARGLEDHLALAQRGQGQRAARPPLPPGVEEIRISSNENPLGPGKAAIDAILGRFPEAGRYPFNSSPADAALVETLAKKYKTKAENIVLGAGSQEILKMAMRAWVSPSKGLVTALPTFENCTGFAKKYGLALVGYEGGQHLVGIQGGDQNAAVNNIMFAANRSPRMRDLYAQYAELRHLTDAWMAAAPAADTLFEYHDSVPAVPDPTEVTVNLRGEKYPLGEVRVAAQVDEAEGLVDVAVYHPGFHKLDDNARRALTFLPLDAALGERLAADRLGRVETAEAEPADAIGLLELRELVADLDRNAQ